MTHRFTQVLTGLGAAASIQAAACLEAPIDRLTQLARVHRKPRPASWLWAIAAPALLLAGCNREFAQIPSPAGSASAPLAASVSAPRADAAVLGGPPASKIAPSTEADLGVGRQLALRGAPGVAACARCHGLQGEGDASNGYPRLANQGRVYLEHQLDSFADGTRANAVMTPIAGAMTPDQRAAASAFFAGLGSEREAAAATQAGRAASAPPTGSGSDSAASASASALASQSGTSATASPASPAAPVPLLAASGDQARGIQGCDSCHGPQGQGDAGAIPYLAGQNAQYLAGALAAWKSGTRHNDPSGRMPAIAKALSEAEVSALVAYFAGLPAPERNAPATGGGRPLAATSRS